MSGEVHGLVVNDAQGLCLKADGDLKYTAAEETAGFFTTIAQKAAALGDESEQPTVRLETTTRSILVTRVSADGGHRTVAVSQAPSAVGSDL